MVNYCQNYRDFEDVFAHRLCVKLRDASVKERKKEKESRRSCTEMFKKKKKTYRVTEQLFTSLDIDIICRIDS